jgi:hypothetical protein
MAGLEDSVLTGGAVALTLASVAAIVWVRARRPAGGLVPVLTLAISVLLLALVLASGGGAWIALVTAALCAAVAGLALLAKGRVPAAGLAYATLLVLALVATWGTGTGRLGFEAPGAATGLTTVERPLS